MSQSAEFQFAAREFARRAADRLRRAALKLDEAYAGDPLPSDTMSAVEAARTGIIDAMSCLGHASHQHVLAVLHGERERAGGGA